MRVDIQQCTISKVISINEKKQIWCQTQGCIISKVIGINEILHWTRLFFINVCVLNTLVFWFLYFKLCHKPPETMLAHGLLLEWIFCYQSDGVIVRWGIKVYSGSCIWLYWYYTLHVFHRACVAVVITMSVSFTDDRPWQQLHCMTWGTGHHTKYRYR